MPSCKVAPPLVKVEPTPPASEEGTIWFEKALAELRPKRIRRQISREEERKQAETTEKLIRRAAGFLASLYKLCEVEDFNRHASQES